MSLDPSPSAAELRRMAEERQARRRGLHVAAFSETIELPTFVRTTPDWPVRLTIPWSLLISDNRKHVPNALNMILAPDYRDAKAKIQEIGLGVMGGVTPVAIPLSLTARVWLPREGAIDIVNRAKLVHDALEKAVYVNDRWLWRILWERAGVDVDAPRAEVSIAPLV